MNYESFLRDLHVVRDRAGRYRQQAGGGDPADTGLDLALQGLDVALEELRVAEEELRSQQAMADEQHEADRWRYQHLFRFAPAAYLVTDLAGVIREANLRAAALLGVDGRFMAGKPLAMFVDGEDRWRFRGRLARLPQAGAASWPVRLRPRGAAALPVEASVAVGRDGPGAAHELRWLLWPSPDGDAAEQAADPPAAAPALDDLAEALHEVAEAVVLLVRADGAGLMLADQAGARRWVTATGEAEQAFERAQRDLGEGPCIDAFRREEVVWTTDLRFDPRWPRLAPAAAGNQVRGVLAVPVGLDGQVLGTCNAITRSPRGWTDADAAAIRAFAGVIGRLLGSTSEARHKGDLAVQLQGALDSRILVEQAKGVLMEREGLSAQAAFDRLRRLARSRSRKIDEVAREVIADRAP